MKTNERTKGTLTEESNLEKCESHTEMTTTLRVLIILLTHPAGFISRIKSHRAAWYDTKAIQTDGTCNRYTGTLIQPDGSAENCSHEKLRYTRYGSFYPISLKFTTKSCAGPYEWSCTDFARGSNISYCSKSRASL